MYVTKADYAGRIAIDLLNLILQDDTATEAELLGIASSAAEGIILTLAGVYYNIPPELALTGAARNGMLLKWARDIATYELYQRIDDAQLPEKVIKNYNDAMDSLEKVSTGKIQLNLPPKPVVPDENGNGTGEGTNTQGYGKRRIGSQTKRSHRP